MVNRFHDLFLDVVRPGDFAVGSVLSSDFAVPAITVNGKPSRVVGLPLSDAQAKEIIAVASKSPFGRREDTLFDDNVRNSWQLDPSQFKINNTKWNMHMRQLLDRVRSGLGITNHRIGCKLYKLLLYETGGHFKFHRDTEKEDGMFGTLIIQLPSQYEGGQITVRHRRREHTFDFAKNASFTPYFAAFYADCEHQVQTVTSGYRLCLIYNLVYSGPGEPPKVHDQSVIYNQLMKLHRAWIKDFKAPTNLIYILEHKYSKAGLNFSNMKGLDATILQLLNKAYTEGKFKVYLAILTRVESGCIGYDGDFETDDISVELSHWIDPSNRVATIPEFSIDTEKQIFPFGRYEDLEMEKEEFEKDTGNAGASIDRWYRTAVIVFWPAERSNNLCIDMEPRVAFQKLDSMISDGVDRDQILHFANKLITQWDVNIIRMIGYINQLRDTQLAIRFFTDVLIKRSMYLPGICQAIKSLITVFGWNTMQDYVVQYLRRLATTSDGMDDGVKFIGELASTTAGSALQPIDYTMCTSIVDSIWTQHCSRGGSSYERVRYSNTRSDLENIATLLVYLHRLNMQNKISTIVTYILQNTRRYGAVTFVSPLVRMLVSLISVANFKALGSAHPFHLALNTCITRINNDVGDTIRPPTNWNLRVTGYNCHDPHCSSCAKVKAFLNNPSMKEFSFKAKLSERTHVERMVRAHTNDVRFQTLRVGTPHTLLITKEWNSYRELVAARQKDVKELKELQRIQKAILQSDEIPSRQVKHEDASAVDESS